MAIFLQSGMATLWLMLFLAISGTNSVPLQFVSESNKNPSYPTEVSTLDCHLCKAGTKLFQVVVGEKITESTIMTAAIFVCKLLKIEDKKVCEGIIPLFAPEVFTVMKKRTLTPDELCGFVFGPECGGSNNPFEMWNITFPNVRQPQPVYPVPPKTGSPTMRFIQLSDIHFDSQYKIGSVADCEDPLCCREGNGGANGAGKFGDYRKCDTPLWTLENLFAHLASKDDMFDYIIWTGDVPAHNVWNQSKSDQINVIAQVTSLFKKYFPKKPIYPAIGNHEGSPVNSFPPAYVKGNNSIAWLYDELVNGWQQWLPKEALATVKWGGYYTVSPYPGFRIISVNMNYCNNVNLWLLLNTTDPNGELAWLIKTLQSAEDSNEKVHIIGHIPPGNNDCLARWSANYYKIISRYQNTITAQFFGHDHSDSFEVFYDVETLKIPINVAYVSPSVTTYSNLNPGFRMYTADGQYKNSSYQILNHETYIMNLTKANEEGKITWELEYSAKTAYNMTGLYARDWDKLIGRMINEYPLIKLYNKHFSKSVNDGTCDDKCRQWLPCMARMGRSHDSSLCKDLGLGDPKTHAEVMKHKPKYC